MDHSEELGPEILEMKISIAGWCFADKKMVLWMIAHHVLTTALHYSGQATKTLFIVCGNQSQIAGLFHHQRNSSTTIPGILT